MMVDDSFGSSSYWMLQALLFKKGTFNDSRGFLYSFVQTLPPVFLIKLPNNYNKNANYNCIIIKLNKKWLPNKYYK